MGRSIARGNMWLVTAVLLAAVSCEAPFTSVASASAMPSCPTLTSWPTRTVQKPVRDAIVAYYVARHLTPVRVYQNREYVLNLKLESVGVHHCKNPDGSIAGYVGVVPSKAIAAVMVHVAHRAYPVTGSASTFMTLVDLAHKGWKVVSDDTGP